MIIPNSVSSIGERAFQSCSGLTSVTISEGVTSIGKYAFSDCSGIISIVSEIESPFAFGSNAFFNISSACILTVPYGKKDAYIAAGWTTEVFQGGIVEMPNPCSFTIGSAGVATFCCTKNLDFSGTDDVKAYIVSTFTPSTGEVTLTRVRDVPANTGLVLIGEPDTYTIPEGTGETIVSNMLMGVTTATTLNKVDGDYTNYIMAKKNGETGFFAVKDGSTLGAGKAYLPLPTASLPNANAGVRLLFVDGEETTGVETVEVSDSAQSDGIYYNLQGQPVEKPSSGIYIVNGKKVWIK